MHHGQPNHGDWDEVIQRSNSIFDDSNTVIQNQLKLSVKELMLNINQKSGGMTFITKFPTHIMNDIYTVDHFGKLKTNDIIFHMTKQK